MRTYGALQLIEGGAAWEMSKLEPHVAIRLKQLFPRVPKNSTGPFRFPRDLVHAADLDWFLTRYPLSMTEGDREALAGGRLAFNLQQAEIERILLPDFSPPPFVGLRDGQIVRHYQMQAVELVRRRRSLLLGDEGGLGKTYTAGAFLCAEPGALPAAVVCDPHMQKQWRDKLTAFTNLRVHVIKQARPYNLPIADVYVFRITQIAGWIDIFGQGMFKAVVYDEPQSLRTGTDTAKGAAAKVLSTHAAYRLGLTATPIYNYGVEMWNVMQFIDDLVLGSFADFSREWVDNNGRIADPKALGTYLREQHVLLRRLKSDVGLELPKVSRIVEYVDYDAKTVQSIEDLARQLAIRATTGTFVERGQAVRELDMMVRQTTGVSKARAVAQFVRLMVEAGEAVLLMGWHRAVYDIWLEELKDLRPAMYTGSETAGQKNSEKDRFMAGDTNVLIMSLRSGAGVDDLQHRCSVVVFGELDWSPGIHQQVIWRLDREGQQHPVTAFFLVTDEGSDPPMMDVLGIKASEARQIIDPHVGVQRTDNDTSNLRKLVERYLAKGNSITRGDRAKTVDAKVTRTEQHALFE
ncbi:SNF2-related protein [Pandoraea communis]|uniref:SNF2-related protein n=1 Tax=Pandoraea communis TaxID=2508297 RepID=UPI0025A53BA7|nr:SNF2-related protein [Pandoraea communis]MDM8356620.1 SNF2-related protein [Pandoraea communis]